MSAVRFGGPAVKAASTTLGGALVVAGHAAGVGGMIAAAPVAVPLAIGTGVVIGVVALIKKATEK